MFLECLDRAGLAYTCPAGAYRVMADIAEFEWESDVAFCEWMAREVGVAAVPGSSFFREPVRHLIRFHFAKRTETLAEAGERLGRLRERARVAGGGEERAHDALPVGVIGGGPGFDSAVPPLRRASLFRS